MAVCIVDEVIDDYNRLLSPAIKVSGVVMPPAIPVSPRYPPFSTIQIQNFSSLKDLLEPFLRRFLRYDAGKDSVFYKQ